jgi:hypothetical protein
VAEIDWSALSAQCPLAPTDGPRSGRTSRTAEDELGSADCLAAASVLSGAETSNPAASVNFALSSLPGAATGGPAAALGDPRSIDRSGMVNARRVADLLDRRNAISVSSKTPKPLRSQEPIASHRRLGTPPPFEPVSLLTAAPLQESRMFERDRSATGGRTCDRRNRSCRNVEWTHGSGRVPLASLYGAGAGSSTPGRRHLTSIVNLGQALSSLERK